MAKSKTLFGGLNLTDETGNRISQEVIDLMRASNSIPDALEAMSVKYDPESVLAGIRFEFALNESKRIIAEDVGHPVIAKPSLN